MQKFSVSQAQGICKSNLKRTSSLPNGARPPHALQFGARGQLREYEAVQRHATSISEEGAQ